ncbi:hypothetical protein NE542_02275 [Faecalibacillus intestinalis]|jgi:ABC-type dipeptide/oligopeptide/nickel transport system ATPase component|uniref:Uncharacterized protein n=1 Tax=Faecalibacillus intestinalis TaxID=1982626 RepID=A0AAP2XQ63_9FIRM|nr:hypothetical protein [Faecalibacillus intestinalis]MCB8591133.1 hypothetical protein [Faecalibacillus intestinalis]MCB8612023.1 hypothetical protein [Faecalibacillus intestinalis]MCG4679667.1 hypothetical protein [Faecalibacillus intestinalis]MCG4712596.1 hypothetical protein [Faecalibacillus intestinalis]MCG4753809.1 hypothetical protein [Faecalibacillus intestinalis]
MKGWHKIDLHQHTLREITYDGKEPQSLYTHEKFENILIEEGVELKAVTNHNTLNIIDHIKHALICKKNNVNYLPGVEIDYLFDSKDIHAITILNPQNDIISYSIKLNEIITNKLGKKFLDKDEFARLHENMEFIFIPHVMKNKGIYPSKDVEIVEEAEDWVINMIRNGIFVPVIFENTQNYNKYSIYGKIEELLLSDYLYPACYVGSDYKFDNDVKRRNVAINRVKHYIFSEPTYRGLEISVRNHQTRMAHESELISRSNYLESIKICDNKNFRNNSIIALSPSLNVIIGGSGSGKTLLLNEIFRCITGNDLKDVKNNGKRKGKSAYFSKIGKGTLLEINSVPGDYKNFKVVEIPNIYTEIMKYVNDHEQLGNVFKISNRSYVNSLINDFISDCNKYSELISDLEDEKKIGSESLRNIFTSIEFLNANPIEKSLFELKPKNMANLDSSKTYLIIENDKKILLKKDEILKYFNEINKTLNFEYKEVVEKIIGDYLFLLEKINAKIVTFEKRKIEEMIVEQIQNLLNAAIRKSSTKLGQKEKIFKEREELLSNNQTTLINCIKNVLKINKEIVSVHLEYPFDQIKNTIETKNANELARFTLSFDKESLKHVLTDDSDFIETKNISTKLKRLPIKFVDFLDDQSIKMFISELKKVTLDINAVIKNELSLTLELNVNGNWKEATTVNQGTIAKVSMEYYFNDIIRTEQPDIIFIDQPENDVDKEFLTQTLAKFLVDKKMTSQIFITSHDAILTVNADANMIIQADVDEDNKINYMSYPLEYTECNKVGTDDVARILDGGKQNIEKRYQIYGGILKYGN